MEQIASFLDRILGYLQQLNRPVASLLQPGLDDDKIRMLTRELPFQVPGVLFELYLWRNGVAPGATLGELNFFPGYYFMSLELALIHYPMLVKEVPPPWWNTHRFPLFWDTSDGVYGIDCSNPGSDDGLIVSVLGGDLSPPERYESLHAMMATLEACYAAGVFYVNENGWLLSHFDREAQIAASFNPNIEYWQRRLRKEPWR